MGLLTEIEKKLKALNNKHTEIVNKLRDDAYTLFCKHMATYPVNELVQKIVQAVENSRDLTPNGEWYAQYTRMQDNIIEGIVDVGSLFEKELFEQYMTDNFNVTVDWNNDAFLYNIGPAIIIDQETGNVYDQDSCKIIIKGTEYSTVDQNHELIEAWMDQNGYYPSVLLVDRYGNARYVDTKPKKSKDTASAE